MIVIKEKNGKVLNFFIPSMVVASGGMLLSFLYTLISFIIFFTDLFLTWDYIIVNLFILLLSQSIGIIIAFFVFIPLFKARNAEYHSLTVPNSIRTVFLICGTFSVVYASNFILVYIFKVFNIIPQSGYNNMLLNAGHLKNPLNILIYYLPITIGAPVYEEILYRRLLIPLMEERGMSPLVAVISSSFIFAFSHLPGDLVNGNLSGSFIHIWGVLLIGTSLGLIYVVTRNVIYSIIIHGAINFISFSGPLVGMLGNNQMILGYNIIILILFIVGIGVFIFGLWQIFRKRSTEWVILLKEKTSLHILYGILGFLIIGIVSVFLPLILQSSLINVAVHNIWLYFIVLIGSYGISLVLFLWLGTRATYKLNNI